MSSPRRYTGTFDDSNLSSAETTSSPQPASLTRLYCCANLRGSRNLRYAPACHLLRKLKSSSHRRYRKLDVGLTSLSGRTRNGCIQRQLGPPTFSSPEAANHVSHLSPFPRGLRFEADTGSRVFLGEPYFSAFKESICTCHPQTHGFFLKIGKSQIRYTVALSGYPRHRKSPKQFRYLRKPATLPVSRTSGSGLCPNRLYPPKQIRANSGWVTTQTVQTGVIWLG